MVVTVRVSVDSCSENSVIDRSGEALTEVPTDIPTSVDRLNLASNQLTELRDCEFCPYADLCRLNLNGNQIRTISPSAFSSTSLSELYLNDNQLPCLESSAFHGLNPIRTLRLKNNQFTTLAKIPLQTTGKIFLSGNPMVCDSRLEWLEAEERKGVTVDGLTCAGPSTPSSRGT